MEGVGNAGRLLRSIRGTTELERDYCGAAACAHELTCRLTWALPVRHSHKRIFHESMLSI